MSRGASVVSVATMSPQALDTLRDTRVRSLARRQAQLERRLERYDAAIPDCNGHDPSLGRERDAASSLLAQVRAELAALAPDDDAGR